MLIDQLPTKILQDIFLNIIYDGSNYPQNIFLVNRRFRDIARSQYYSTVRLSSIKASIGFANIIRSDATIAQYILDLCLRVKYLEKSEINNEEFFTALEFILAKCNNIDWVGITTDSDVEIWKIYETEIEKSSADYIIIRCIESLDKSTIKSLNISSKTCSTLATERISSFSWPKLTRLMVELPTPATATAQIVSRCPSLCELNYETYEDSIGWESFDNSILQALIEHCPNFHTLAVTGVHPFKFDASEEDLINFIKEKGPGLKDLSLVCNGRHPLSNEILKTIRYYAQNITYVDLGACEKMDNIDEVIKLLNTCRNLTNLRLSGFKMPIERLRDNLAKVHGVELEELDFEFYKPLRSARSENTDLTIERSTEMIDQAKWRGIKRWSYV